MVGSGWGQPIVKLVSFLAIQFIAPKYNQSSKLNIQVIEEWSDKMEKRSVIKPKIRMEKGGKTVSISSFVMFRLLVGKIFQGSNSRSSYLPVSGDTLFLFP